MSYFIYSLIAFLLAMGIFTGTGFWINSLQISSATDKNTCETNNSSNAECHMWDGNVCWKGVCDPSMPPPCSCIRKNTTPITILWMLGFILILLAILFLSIGFIARTQTSTASMNFCSSSMSSN